MTQIIRFFLFIAYIPIGLVSTIIGYFISLPLMYKIVMAINISKRGVDDGDKKQEQKHTDERHRDFLGVWGKYFN